MRSIEEQNGYPPVIGLGTNELKVIKTDFMKALLYIMKSRWTIKCRNREYFSLTDTAGGKANYLKWL